MKVFEELPQIQGKQPDSKEEYWVAMALERLRIKYLFQFDLVEPRIRGGITIDFLILFPFGIPMEIMGEYWHPGEMEASERFRQNEIENYFGQKVIYLWTLDLTDPETTYSKVKQVLGR